ncbi:FGGY-family carbohydrate kinase [Herbiconiux sp. CPCC 203407]|uniref:FGGY-family carbohydrate kinase n=1 Tax=Herbiconiux oxytropis TaxID=2970915 RepID=A0AA42BWP5_9MICO|nr:FGGY-family carbohydrate kinase [Herbiconiux oxytropis]MCS5721585.1 FGGY-family carbohydrate kinase [Herbiconiux oxytropis]MCS5726788.1 FGGY-family carbohydrate kinase [Herbiconiux oxytropis]
MSEPATTPAEAILSGRTSLGIELGSTRIKACLIADDDPTQVLAVGSHDWENEFVDRVWTYSLDAVWTGLQQAYAALVTDAETRHGVRPDTFGALGISAMMHGYLAFDAEGSLLVPFRTWRNTSTGPASAELTELFGLNIPLRWSIAHLHQAVLDAEPHVPQIHSITTLAGYVHERLTGRHVIGIGDASGMFPIDSSTLDYDAELVARYDALSASASPASASGSDASAPTLARPLADLLPEVLVAGQPAGELTAEGAALLDPTGTLRPGIPLCPPEGDAGTGMVATASVAPRTGNVSAGTSIFAMIVLERPLAEVHHELDLVTTPAGDPVAMVHCNNGASELAAWAGLFTRFAQASRSASGSATGSATGAATGAADSDAVFDILFREALEGEADAGGLLAYNHLSGEPIAGLDEGRPLVVRTPDSRLTLGNFMRAQLYGVFGTLALGMRVLHGEGVAIDSMFAHGGMFRTAGVAQRFLAGALDAPVSVAATASEGGPWGIAVLAAFASATRGGAAQVGGSEAGTTQAAATLDLGTYLRERVFADAPFDTTAPDPADVAGFATYLERYRAGLAVERAAVESL